VIIQTEYYEVHALIFPAFSISAFAASPRPLLISCHKYDGEPFHALTPTRNR